MKFVLNLTAREIRSSWKRLLFFFLCIAIGVGSVVALRSLTRNLSQAVGGDARELLTADFVINSTSPFTPDDLSRIDRVTRRSGIIEKRTETIEVSRIARPADPKNKSLRFVALKGVEPDFPLVGSFVLTGTARFGHSLLSDGGAIAAVRLLDELKIKVGDRIRIGKAVFTVRATFEEEPGGSGGFRIGTRVFIDRKQFDRAGITQTTGRVRRRILFRTSSNPTALVSELREALKGTTLTIQFYREVQEDIGEQFERTENYLSLTGLLILVLGGVGVWNVARAFVEQKRKSVAVLKCLGAAGNRVISVYLLQILTLGLIGSLFGIALAQLTLWFIGFRFADSLPRTMGYQVPLAASAQGIALGLLVSLLFSALPLLNIRSIKPKLLLRDETGSRTGRLDRTKWLIGLASLAGLVVVAAWQAGSFKIGVYFLVSLSLTTLALYAFSSLLVWILKMFRNLGRFSFKQAVNSLYRPGNQTRVVLLAVGLGAFVILTVQSLQSNLLRVFDFSNNQNFPSLFFVDIQRSQIEPVMELLEAETGEEPEKIPTVRARVVLLNGKPFNFDDRQVRRRQGRIGREFAITYRKDLEENETIVSGRWWKVGDDGRASEPGVSVEERFASRLGAKVGDRVTFDISGRKITAPVANIRQIDFSNSRTSFIFVFSPGILEKAPQSFLVTVLKKLPEDQRVELKNSVLDKFPNVQIFDVLDIAVLIQKIVNNFVLAISFVGSFVLLSGMLILIGSIALTKSQRVYENAILKTLGANRITLSAILLSEYGILGLLAGVIGAAFAMSLSYVVSEFVFEIAWEPNTALMAAGIGLTVLLVMAVGTLASFDVLFRKPLGTLRSQ